ncbi:(2Fe-2S)-binding protein [Desulfonema ishimotonii]|uniref:(2Fe-2S)-binding protein n=1 Tax=Desulfonema ishimotonii TaxID=45657 RepID=A0A401G361_9BACT|nr:Rieske 2Fe-2S domain-containing protein [Desulfonema ishimotonii]GBC63555.1 (2Fe-2S)-binding protein [Desulfonema ishimotonii]
MKLLKRIFGICETSLPSQESGWSYAAQVVTVSLNQMPELANPGGAVRLEGRGLPERVLLLHGTDGLFHAFANKCTHMGRRLDPMTGKEMIQCCSVSRSTFTYGGDKVSGAAKEVLRTFPVTVDGNKLRISLG